jgi:4-hydroxybenzoate polyprenyltransferase
VTKSKSAEEVVERRQRFSRPAAFFWILRLNRTIMVAAIAGTGAFAAGAGVAQTLWMTLAGWCLAVGGFSLDLYADRDVDAEGPRSEIRHNPFTDGSLSAVEGLAFSVTFIVASFIIAILISPWAILPWSIILAVIIGLALHVFERPLPRALTLGLLQGLYVLLGSTAGQLTPAIGLLAGMFFFAMFGGRAMTDIRDFPQDQATRVQTLPKRYGIKRTAQLLAVCLILASALSLAAYFTGEFSTIYLYLDIAFIVVSLVCAWLFVIRPSPRLAYYLTLVCMMGLGTIICLAMILGSL